MKYSKKLDKKIRMKMYGGYWSLMRCYLKSQKKYKPISFETFCNLGR